MSDVVAPGWPAPRRQRLAPTLMLALIAATAAIILAHGGAEVPAPVASAPAAPIEPASPVKRARWVEIVRPVQIYSLEAPELGRLPPSYTARRSSDGDVREDRLAFGSPGGDRPALRLALLRGGVLPATALGAAVSELVAADGLTGTVATGSTALPTRFGSFAVLPVAVGAPTGRVSCQGFRLAIASPSLAITGLACGARGGDLTAARLSCLIDRLDLASAGEDLDLSAFFAASELRRDAACRGMRLGPDEVHAPWLDDKPATSPSKLRHHEGMSEAIRPS